MTTAVLSDLHLGDGGRRDVMRRPEVRRALLDQLDGVDRVVLLGDTLELRQRPAHEVLQAAEPFFEELVRVLPSVAVVLVPGNHDHALVAPWLDDRRLHADRGALEVEQLIEPRASGALAAAIAEMGAGGHLCVAYPGLWLRPDVYASHGHYLDCHMTMPRLECLMAAACERAVGGLPGEGEPRSADDYEAALAPIYSLAHALAQSSRDPRRGRRPDPTMRFWGLLQGEGALASARARFLEDAAVPAALAVINRVLPRRFSSDLSDAELLRSGLEAMAIVLERLGVAARYSIFGHTHRAGPWPDDDPAPWRLVSGGRLLNPGSWLDEPSLPRRDRSTSSPYDPGSWVLVGDEGPPELRRALRPAPSGDGFVPAG